SIAAKMNTGDILLVSYDVDGAEGCAMYMVTATTGDIALTRGSANGAAIAALGALTENGGAIGGTNDGDLPALTGTASGTDAAIVTALQASVRELAAKVNALIAAA